MGESSRRNLGGSRESLRAAIGRLDAATPASAGPEAAGVPALQRPAVRWVMLLVLVAGAAAALASLISA